METKSRIKPNWFLTSEKENLNISCPMCGGPMEKVLHTPKSKPPIYHCLRCNNYSYDYRFGLLDL